ncbi:hypothetical protein WJX84_000084 [Apatococcus fuscideae]|uniref:Uncharacterized protein n=1 Tax=Apatococcus fuscideae TaxID=2026836 RepID=A0AAW1T398_9CHLO
METQQQQKIELHILKDMLRNGWPSILIVSMKSGQSPLILASPSPTSSAHSLGLTAQVVPVMQPEVYQLVCQANDQYDGSVRDHFLTGVASKLAFRHLRCPEDEDYKNQEQICRRYKR